MKILIAVLFLASSVLAQQAPPQAPPQGPPPKNLVKRPDGRFTANEDPENPERFEVHVVIPGDTLSGIALRVLNNARLWPQLWEQNEHIINPHWIYPNDKILIRPITPITEAEPPPVPEPPQPEPPPPPPAPEPPPPPPPEPEPVPPREGEFRLDPPRPVPEVKPSDMYCSGFVQQTAVARDLKIIAKHEPDNSALSSSGDYVYLGQGSEDGIAVGNRYQVIRPTKRLDGNLGMHYLDVAQVQVVMTQPDFSLARVTHNCEAAEYGDLLIPYQDVAPPAPPRPRPFSSLMTTTGDVKGAVVVSKSALTNFGSTFKASGITPGIKGGHLGPLERGIGAEGEIVYLNVGQEEGVKSGDLFIVFKEVRVDTGLFSEADPGRLRGHRVAIGELIVLKVGERAASALVTYASDVILEGSPVERR